MNCVLIAKQAVAGSGFLPLSLVNEAFSPEKAQKSGLFHITFRILIGILTGKTFTENSSSKKSMPASHRHSVLRQMYLIPDHPSIFVPGKSLGQKALKITMQVTRSSLRSLLPGLHGNTTPTFRKLDCMKTHGEGLARRFIRTQLAKKSKYIAPMFLKPLPAL